MKRWFLVAIVFIGLVTGPLSASADDVKSGRAGISLGFTTKSVEGASSLHFSPVLFGSYKVMKQVLVTADWGFSYTSLSPDIGDATDDSAIGNPYIAGHYILMDARGIHLSAGLGFAPPVAPAPDDDDLNRGINFGYALGSRGLMAPWMWLPETFGVVLPIEGSMRFTSGLITGFDFVVGLLVPTGDNETDTDLTLDIAVDLGYALGTIVPGVRFTAVMVVSGDFHEHDQAQFAAEPYIRASFGSAFARLGFLINLDEPMGMSFDDEDLMKVWGLHLSGGASF